MTSMAFLLLVQVKRFWAATNKTHLSVIRGALVAFQVAVTKVCPPRPDRLHLPGRAHPRGDTEG